MKKLTLILGTALSLAACSSVPAPPPKPLPVPPVLRVFNLTPGNCPRVRVLLEDGAFATAWGGAEGLRVPENTFNIQAFPFQLECKYDGVWKPFKEK